MNTIFYSHRIVLLPFFSFFYWLKYKSVVDIATNIDVITYNDGFQGLLDVMSIVQMKINSELNNFSIRKSLNVELKPQTTQHRNIEKALGKTLRSLEKKQKSKTHAWKGSYMVLG